MSDLPMWKENELKLKRTFRFENFPQAIQFIVRVSEVCENMNHHPELTNIYNTVHIELCTHDAGNIITEKDRTLAREIDRIYKQMTK